MKHFYGLQVFLGGIKLDVMVLKKTSLNLIHNGLKTLTPPSNISEHDMHLTKMVIVV